MVESFGFIVRELHLPPANLDKLTGANLAELTDAEFDDYGNPARTAGWVVYLPHSCDEWVIAGGYSRRDGIPHTDAVESLRRFVTEAQAALTALEASQPYGGTDRG